jgi:hypothetical protein
MTQSIQEKGMDVEASNQKPEKAPTYILRARVEAEVLARGGWGRESERQREKDGRCFKF